jgi:flagellar motor switch/type III secretory pathway protein FliN
VNARPYPWHTLESIPRDVPALLRDARAAIASALDATRIAEVLGEMLGERVRMEIAPPRVADPNAPSLAGPKVTLTTADDAVRLQIELETELARTLVARILGRPIRLGDPRSATSPEIEGAALAIITQIARRAHGTRDVLRPLGAGALRWSPGERRLAMDAAIMLGGEAYAAKALLDLRRRPVAFATPSSDVLAQFGNWPISLAVVAAISNAEAADLYALAQGDVWLPGRGWLVERAGKRGASPLSGSIFLSSPTATRALAGRLGEAGEIVLVGVKSLPVDEESSVAEPAADHDTATSEVVLDAPIVVRVEMGAVTMTLREWAALGAGDVIALGRRVTEPVVLRAAGLEVARGELVDIEGELGVRIHERVKPA